MRNYVVKIYVNTRMYYITCAVTFQGQDSIVQEDMLSYPIFETHAEVAGTHPIPQNRLNQRVNIQAFDCIQGIC